jgi:hypothetical protein
MKHSFIQPVAFVNEWKHFRLDDEDLQALERQLSDRPEAGKVIKGTGGARKVRFAPPGLAGGKSGAYRIVYVHKPDRGRIWLLSIFAKADQADMNPRQRAAVKAFVESL